MPRYQPFTPIDVKADAEWSQKFLEEEVPSSGLVWDSRPKPKGAIKTAIEIMSLEEWAERYWQACDKDWSRELQLLCDGKDIPLEPLQVDGDEGILFHTWCLLNIPPGPVKPYKTYKKRYIKDIIAALKKHGIK